MTLSAPAVRTAPIQEEVRLNIQIVKAGLMPYDQALELQLRLLALRQQDRVQDTLLLLEHPPVITLGTRGRMDHIYRSEEELASAGISLYKVGRGGDVTYHGPGQLILYPIVKLYHRPGGIRDFIEMLEQAVMTWLWDVHRVRSICEQGKLTGVWVEDAKIMAIGLAVKQGVTMHGLALNLNVDLTPFGWINPCGLDRPVTSLHILRGQPVSLQDSLHSIGDRLAGAMDAVPVWMDRQALFRQIDRLEAGDHQPDIDRCCWPPDQ